MTKSLSRNLGHMFVFPLPLLGIFDSKASAEDLSDGLEWHSLAFWVAEDDEEPAKEADATIESESATRSQSFHHRQEG
jgi:hypothetical protein